MSFSFVCKSSITINLFAVSTNTIAFALLTFYQIGIRAMTLGNLGAIYHSMGYDL